MSLYEKCWNNVHIFHVCSCHTLFRTTGWVQDIVFASKEAINIRDLLVSSTQGSQPSSKDTWKETRLQSCNKATESLHSSDKICWNPPFVFQMITPESPWRWRTARATLITSMPARWWVPPLHSNTAAVPGSHSPLAGTKTAYRREIQILMQRLLSFGSGPMPPRSAPWILMTVLQQTPRASARSEKAWERTCARLLARFSFVETKLISGVLGNDCFWPWVMLIEH